MYLNGPNDMSRSIDKVILAQSDSTSNSGKVTNNSTSWWSDEEYRLFNVWASSYEKQNAAFANPYFDYFFTGQDIQVSLYGLENPNDALPVYSLAYNIEQQKMPLYGFWDYCVDKDTMALTKRGWLTGDQINENDIILSMDPKDGILKWSTIKSIYRNYDFNDKVFKITGAGIDAIVTQGHKFALTTGELKAIDDISHQDTIRTMGEALDSKSEVYTDAFVELVGWYITEGHDRKDCNAIEIDQSIKVNPEKVNRIEQCLKALDVNYGKYNPRKNGTVKFYIGVKESIVNQLKLVAPKKIPTYNFIFNLSSYQIKLLIETMIDGDGSRKNGQANQYGQGKHCVDQLDVFMALCALAGISTYKSGKAKNGQTTVTLRNRKVASGQKLNFNGGYTDKRSNLNKNIPTEIYQGLVWCPETEFGTFVCKRNNRVYVTGNTYSAMLRGTRIISGAFSIVAMYPHLLTKAIAKASFNISKGEKSSATNWKAIRTLNEDERNITKFWRRNFDYNLDLDQQHLFSVHPPFHLIIKYGIQSTSLSEYSGAIPYMPSSRSSQSRIAELEKDFRYAANGYMLTDVNERLVRDSSEITTKIALENVEIMSKSISYGVDGEPIMETYTFLARDERIINDNTDRSYSDSSLIYNPTVDAPDIYGRLSSAGGSANITS